MAKDKQQYLERCSIYQSSIDTILAWEAKILSEMSQVPSEIALTKLNLIDKLIDLTSYYIVGSKISLAMLETRNEDMLNNGRKAIIKAITYMEDIVSPYLDAPVSDYQERLDLIEQINAKQRCLLIRKMGIAIELLVNAYGDNTKWRWSFVDIEGRAAIVTKNFFDMKNAVVNLDLRSPFYEFTVCHLQFSKKLLAKIADRYREKYELSGSVPDDLKQGINFLNALRRIHILLGESDAAELAKKKADVWAAKLDADINARAAEEK
jgi:hypothetical protein